MSGKGLREQEQRRQRNLAKFYNDRQEAATNDREIAHVLLDRARAVAAQRTREGDAQAWYSLASALAEWCGDR